MKKKFSGGKLWQKIVHTTVLPAVTAVAPLAKKKVLKRSPTK